MGMYDAQEASIRRQQMIAKALRDSGNQGFDPAASAGRLVYARSPWEDINKIAQLGVASYLDNRAEKRSGDLQDQRKADAKTRLAGMVDTLAGKSQNVLNQPNDPALSPLSGDVTVRNPVTGANETVGVGTEMNTKRAGLAAILKGADPEEAVTMLQGKALEKALPTYEKVDMGGQLGWADSEGNIVRTVDKSATKDAVLGANVSIRGQDIGERNNVRDNATSMRGQDVSAATSRYATNAGVQNNQLDNETSRLNAQLAADVSRDNARLQSVVDREKIAATKAGDQKLNEWQAKSLSLQARMEDAEASLLKDYKPGFWVSMASQTPGVGSTGALTSDEYNSYKQAARQWISGILRLDSGAAVPDSEFATYFQTYFPQFGESDAVAAQKKAAREQIMTTGRSILGDLATTKLPARPAYQNPLEVGKVPTFASEAEAEAAGLKPGTKVIINGRQGTWQ